MLYHPGIIIEIFDTKDKSIISSDAHCQVTAEMWDENIMTFKLEHKLASKAKEGNFILVDYSPISEKLVVPKHKVVKVLNGTRGKKMWEKYKLQHSKRKMQMTAPKQFKTVKKKSSQPYIG